MSSRMKIESGSRVHLSLAVEYVSEYGKHRDVRHFERFHPSRDMDLLPVALRNALMGRTVEDHDRFDFAPGHLTDRYSDDRRYTLHSKEFNRDPRPGVHIDPRRGRFYPKGWFQGVPGVFSDNMMPARLAEIDSAHMQADFNHPLADHELGIEVEILDVMDHFKEHGEPGHDCLADLLEGPGMQLRYRQQATDFFSDDPFVRSDENPDSLFYTRPRLVKHLDERALQQLQALHGELIPDNASVLDLMSSMTSHLPDALNTAHVSGLGLNRRELEANARLDRHIIHDLNEDPRIPCEDAVFDVVLCSASIEYLNQPQEVFAEVARVLKPGGLFVVSFSNRWFPTKAIRLWPELHEYERMGLVSEYFLQSGCFEEIHTRSIRGLPRPENDRYRMRFSDPVYAVWGRVLKQKP